MGESGLHLPPLLRNAEIASENDHVIARLEVLVPLREELVEVGQECEEIINNRVDTAIDASFGETFGNIILEVIRQERFESIHVPPGVVQLPDESDLRRSRHANLPYVDVDGLLERDTQVGRYLAATRAPSSDTLRPMTRCHLSVLRVQEHSPERTIFDQIAHCLSSLGHREDSADRRLQRAFLQELQES